MENLNKNQIVLLTLLISFVTSIATGIMTASLLQEAPVEVTRNINRIVEKTIETVTPAGITTGGESKKEVVTVVVKEEDLVISSIEKNIKSIVRIYEKDAVTGLVNLYGIGLIVSKDGFIIADNKILTTGNSYSAKISDGKEFPLTLEQSKKQTNFVLFKINKKESETISFTPVTLASSNPKLGQTLTVISGEGGDSVAVGRVISLDMKESGTGTSTVKYLASINTDISAGSLVNGSPTFNLSGDVAGVRLTSDSNKSFTPVSILKNELDILMQAPKTE